MQLHRLITYTSTTPHEILCSEGALDHVGDQTSHKEKVPFLDALSFSWPFSNRVLGPADRSCIYIQASRLGSSALNVGHDEVDKGPTLGFATNLPSKQYVLTASSFFSNRNLRAHRLNHLDRSVPMNLYISIKTKNIFPVAPMHWSCESRLPKATGPQST